MLTKLNMLFALTAAGLVSGSSLMQSGDSCCSSKLAGAAGCPCGGCESGCDCCGEGSCTCASCACECCPGCGE